MSQFCPKCHDEMVRVRRSFLWSWWPWGRKFRCLSCGRKLRVFFATEQALSK